MGMTYIPNKKLHIRLISIILALVLFLTIITTPAYAAYSVGFGNANIQITSPSINNAQYEKFLTIAGTSSLSKVWLCLRGPNGELSVYPLDVQNGSFQKDIWLRFGPGKYTIWAGDNEKQFDGKIRFEVQNTSSDNYFPLTPSGYVNSDDLLVQNTVKSVIREDMNDLAKAKVIHDWVVKNIVYDTAAYYEGKPKMNTAVQVLKDKKGTCRDYSFAFAALARAAGIETRVVYGDAWNSALKKYEKHAWNEVFIAGQWLSIDTTWDSGYISNKKFVIASTQKYFNMDAETFKKTHKMTSLTLF
jgi:hypothetical protein